MVDKQLILFYLINGFGGLCVLGSYAHGLITNPSIRGGLWGAIPDSLRLYYTIFMFLPQVGIFSLQDISYSIYPRNPLNCLAAMDFGR